MHMTAKEVKLLRKRLGRKTIGKPLSQGFFAQFLGIKVRTLQGWERRGVSEQTTNAYLQLIQRIMDDSSCLKKLVGWRLQDKAHKAPVAYIPQTENTWGNVASSLKKKKR